MNTPSGQLLFAGLLFTLISCRAGRNEFSYKTIKKDYDTVFSQQAMARIKSIDNNLFSPGSFSDNGVPINYRLLVPKQSTDSMERFPLIIVFHGSGAIGDDNQKQLGMLAKLWALPDIRSNYAAFVVVPQFPSRSSDYVWDSSRQVLVSVPQPCLTSSLQLLDSLIRSLPVDEKRIYAVGFSMGASSVINALTLRPQLFAAAVSISGIPQFDNIKALSAIPIWMMHGNADTENPFSSDWQFYKEVKSKNKTRFWEFDRTGHVDILSSVLPGDMIPKWLFQYKKS